MERFNNVSLFKYHGVILSEDEVKNKGSDDNNLNNDSLMDYSHFEKITMALVDEAQLSSIKEKRRQLEEENKIGIHTRELSVHVDNFKNNSIFDLNNTNNEGEIDADNNMEDGTQGAKPINNNTNNN